MKYYPALVGALGLAILVLFGLRWEVCEVDIGAAAHAATVPTGPWELPVEPVEPYPPATVMTIDCVHRNGQGWAEAHYPGRSVAELVYVHMYAHTDSTGPYGHELVSYALLRYEWIAAPCEPGHTAISFVMTDYLDESSG